MMNQYRDRYGRMGGRMTNGGDFSPYRRPPIRDDMTPRSFNRPGGCGCGLGNTYRPNRQAEDDRARRPENGSACASAGSAPLLTRERTFCGCDNGNSALNGDFARDRQRASCGCDSGNSALNGDLARDRQRASCGCEDGRVSVRCRKLMEQIRAVDFALYETVLYLDVYPHSCDALETYRKLKSQSEALHAEYEATHGPLTAFGNGSSTSWDWMSKPFPWEYDAE